MTLTIYKETTWRKRLTVRTTAGALYPLSATTLDFVVSKRTTSAALVTLTNGSGITLADQSASPGIAEIQILAPQVADLDPGAYVFAVGATTGGVRQLVIPPTRLMIRDTPG